MSKDKRPIEVIKEKVEKLPESTVKGKILEDIEEKMKTKTIHK